MRSPSAFIALAAFATAGDAQPDPSLPLIAGDTATQAFEPDFARLINAFSTDANYVARFYAVYWSEPRLEHRGALLDTWIARLSAIAPGSTFDKLSPAAQIDYVLLRNHLEHEKAELALELRRLKEMDAAVPFRKPIQELEFARRRLEDPAPGTAAAFLSKIPDEIKALRAKVDAGRKPDASPDSLKLTPVVANRTAGLIEGLRRDLREWAEHYEGYRPEFAWWTRQPRDATDRALADYAKFLREDIAGIRGGADDPLIGDPIGREALLADLASEHLAYSPEELLAIGEAQLAWCEDEMKKAAAEMGFGEDWKAALAKVKESHVDPGDQDRFVRDEARAVTQWLKDRNLLTIPPLCEESWRIEMHSIETQRTLPFAVYGGQYMGVSYPTDAMSHADKLMSMRGNNRHFTHIVTPHELIPGHHLQGFYAQRLRNYREPFSTPFFVEGWALYWEMRFWELGWAGATGHDAAMDRIGMLFWRMHRAARIIVSLKFHLGEMSPQQMIDFLVQRVGHETFGATSEVRRYIGGSYSPLYQCAYLIGGLQIRALHKELVESGTMNDKQFNDLLMTYNSIPIELVRAGMLAPSAANPLTRDAKPAWRFAGDPAPAPAPAVPLAK
jgi:hypothetical protein